jgi:integrase
LTLQRITPDLSFNDASALWIASRSLDPSIKSVRGRFITQRTEKSYHQYIDSLNLFFGNLRLDQIHLGHLRQYQEARVTGAAPFIRKRRPNKNVVAGPCPCAPKKVNQELSILKTIMSRAGCWTHELGEYYEPFKEEIADVPRALLAQEQQKWLDVCLTQQRWWLIYWYSQLAFETSMSTNELRSLRIGDVNLFHGIVNIPAAGGKNQYRVRTIPLITAEARWSAEQLLARARDLGATSPLQYLFPFRKPPKPFDPDKPMTVSGIKMLWNEVRNASGLKWFRPYDTRHTAITRWAERGVQISDIMVMAGHVNKRMTLHYTHICQQAKREQMEQVAGRMHPKPVTPIQAAPFYFTKRA